MGWEANPKERPSSIRVKPSGTALLLTRVSPLPKGTAPWRGCSPACFTPSLHLAARGAAWENGMTEDGPEQDPKLREDKRLDSLGKRL
jgi:hypothetical protein